MALIVCPDCHKSISDQASACPECGRPMAVQQAVVPAHQGSAGNVLAGLASFFIPGLGQLVQGRVLAGFIHFVAAGVFWFFLMGWVVHLLSAVGAAMWKPPQP